MEEWKVGIIGIDESNHGKVPETFTGILSGHLEDIIHEHINKRGSKKCIPDILKDRDFRFIQFLEEDKQIINPKYWLLIASCEFISFFMEEYKNIKKERWLCIIDGEDNFSYEEKIGYILKLRSKSIPEIVMSPKADETYPIVNKADNIAYILNKGYTEISSNNYIKSRLIKPNLKDYIKILDKYNKERNKA